MRMVLAAVLACSTAGIVAVPSGLTGQAAGSAAAQSSQPPDAALLLTRIDLVRQHYTSSRVAGAELELASAVGLVRSLRTAQHAQPSTRRQGQPPRAGVDTPMPGFVRRPEPDYPVEAAIKGITGHVVVDAVIDKAGKIRDARVVRSIPELDGAALAAVRKWRFAKPVFSGKPADVAATFVLAFTIRRDASPTSELDLARFYIERAEYDAAEAALGRAYDAIAREARCSAEVATAASAQRKAGVGDSVPPRRIRDVQPFYSALAIKAKVTGTVMLEAVVGVDGRPACVRVLRSVPLLDQAAIDAFSRWEFTPMLLNGAPVPARISAEITFALR